MAEIASQVGVRCINEPVQGYMHARNADLFAASGKYVLNALSRPETNSLLFFMS